MSRVKTYGDRVFAVCAEDLEHTSFKYTRFQHSLII